MTSPAITVAPPARSGADRRIDVLDVLRGLAILGTLGTNIWIFTDPAGPASVFTAAPAQGAVETSLRWLTNGKFLGLLTVLFGVGLELQYRSARRHGRTWPGWYLWRATLLFVEGLLHYLLVFEFDVLMGYAVISMLVVFLIGRRDRVVRTAMGVAAGVHLAAMALLTLAPGSSGPSDPPGGVGLFSTGSYAEQVAARVEWAGLYRAEVVLIIPLGVLLFLAGSRLLRAGVFDDTARGAQIRNRLMIAGLAVAAPLDLAAAFAGPRWFFVERYVLAPLVAVGLLGLVTTLVHRLRNAPAGPARRGLTAVGRTALTCYIVQNLLATVVCYGWGLGLAARFEDARPWWVAAAWAAISLIVVAGATWWLRHFDRGPVELVWHRVWLAPQRRRSRF